MVPPFGHKAAQDDPLMFHVLLSASFLLLLTPPVIPYSASCYYTSSFSCDLFRDERVEDGRGARPDHQGAISLHHHGYFDELPRQSLKCGGDVCQNATVDWS